MSRRPLACFAPCLVALLLAVGAAAQERPECIKVVSAAHHNVNLRRGLPAGAAAVARELNTDVIWVRRCMEIYGRLPAGRVPLTEDERSALEEATEEGEPVEEVLRRRSEEEGLDASEVAEPPHANTRSRKKKEEGFDPVEKDLEAGLRGQ